MSNAPCTELGDPDGCDSDNDGVLTHCAMFRPDTGWHAALTMPLPNAPDITLLDHARQWVLLYLDWVTGDLALRAPPKELAHAIKIGADACACSLSPCRPHLLPTRPNSPRTCPANSRLSPRCAHRPRRISFADL